MTSCNVDNHKSPLVNNQNFQYHTTLNSKKFKFRSTCVVLCVVFSVLAQLIIIST